MDIYMHLYKFNNVASGAFVTRNYQNNILLKKIAQTFGTLNKTPYLCTRNSEITNPIAIENAPVAQLVEHLTLYQRVQGSNPCRRTKGDCKKSPFCVLCVLYLFYTK